jgi:hypothetical protein
MKYLFAAIGGYAVGWTLVYTLLMDGDFRYFFTYLRLAWTGPGERPAFIQAGAIAVALVAPLCLWGWLWLRAKRRRG